MKFYGELLVFVLLFITNLRVFFVHHVRRDPLVVLAPFTFVVAILQIFSWGVDTFTLLGLLISFFVLISNFHAIFRYWERLYVDHYSPLMKIWAAFTIAFSTAALALSIYFAPIEQKNREIMVNETQTHYKGSFRSGFFEAKPFDSKSLTIYEFSKIPESANIVNNQNLIVFLAPDKRADTANYRPYLQQLAARGVTVCSADFYADDGQWLHNFYDKRFLRRIVMVIKSFTNQQQFLAQKEYYSFNIAQEYNAMVPLLHERYGYDKKILLITDFMADIAAEDYQKKNPDFIAGILKLSSIGEYKSSGYGCIEQTDPLLAKFLNLQRDKTLATPILLAEKTIEKMDEIEKLSYAAAVAAQKALQN